MTSGHPRAPRRALLPAVVALLGALLLVLPLWSTPGAAAASAACVADASTGCIGGTIRSAAGQPAAGVVLKVEGQGQSVEARTDDTGRWSAAVTAAGEYTVTLDEGTLPAGETLRDPGANPRTVTVELGGTTGALFPLGAPVAGGAGGAPTSEAPTTDDGGAAVPPDGQGGDEADVAPESAAAGSGGAGGRFVQLVASGLIFGLLLALASVGLSLLYGTTGLSNFAHGEQVTLGALLAYFFVQVQGLPLPVAGALAVLGGLLSGYLQDRGIWGPLRRKGIGLVQQIIVTIGLSLSLQYTFNLLAGGGSLRIVTSSPGIVQIGPVRLTEQSAVSVVIAVLVLAGVGYFLTGTRIGRATRAVADNAALAAASGIAVDRIVRLVWTVGAGLAALGGVLLGLYLNATRWNMGTALLLLMFAAVTLGGLGTAFGALAGSLVIGLVVELSTLLIPSDMRYAAALLILILVLLLRPQGILGRAERIG
ncbi:amino acid/amide ABC transporter membrane protein 1 (HAAT family) [Georgenia soli]|uniref:Amino acid/amide ABC transporter membrane protein 1 (HAAT family) n=1 Tax=Georgenia soli TaxID=638953 RepID=A0A2A9EGY5_9MICO|nr:branched-chain amino acid ABC transporter permease [Georgenia soli]PFG38168.1 amino acid/amide ABC transporter membrane protein 1 (HAAT family) [Georgenia soli]